MVVLRWSPLAKAELKSMVFWRLLDERLGGLTIKVGDVEHVDFVCIGDGFGIKSRSNLKVGLSYRLYRCCGMDTYRKLASDLEYELCPEQK
jgi:hypothetical protein